MTLPKVEVHTFTLEVPSTKQEVEFRPFLVKEEKILLLSKESDDPKTHYEAMKKIIDACTFNKLDVDKLGIFDIEYIFMQLRAKSVGEVIEINMRCINEIEKDGNKVRCNNIIPFNIKISDIEVIFPEGHSNVIKLWNDIGVTMRYPSLETLMKIDNDDYNESDIVIDLIDNIFDDKNVYDAMSIKREEIEEFVMNLPAKEYEKIHDTFFSTMPKLEYTIEYVCSKCGHKDSYTFSGISDFF